MMTEPHEPDRAYGSGESFILEGPPVIFDHKRWSSSFAVDEEAAAAKGWRRGEHGWVKDVAKRCICDGGAYGVQPHPFIVHSYCPVHNASVPSEVGKLRWVLSAQSSEVGAQRGQFMQSWDGYEGDQVRLRVQIYLDGRIMVYPFKHDESEAETVWELPAVCTHESETDDSRINSAYHEYICVACGRIRQGEHK